MVKVAPPLIAVSTSVSPARRSSKWWEQYGISLREISFLSVRQKVPIFSSSSQCETPGEVPISGDLLFQQSSSPRRRDVSVSLEYLPSSEDSYRLASNIMLLCMYKELPTISNRCCGKQMSCKKACGAFQMGTQTDQARLSTMTITLNKTAHRLLPNANVNITKKLKFPCCL